MGKGGGGGGSGSNVTATSTSTVDIVGLDDIKLDAKFTLPQPFKTEAKNEIVLPQPLKTEAKNEIDLAVTQPIRSESDNSVALDLKPVVLDLCVTTNVGHVPNLCVRQPYHHKFGVTVFGIEWFALTLSGEPMTIVEETKKNPYLAVGGGRSYAEKSHAPERAAAPRPPRGLRIRVGS